MNPFSTLFYCITFSFHSTYFTYPQFQFHLIPISFLTHLITMYSTSIPFLFWFYIYLCQLCFYNLISIHFIFHFYFYLISTYFSFISFSSFFYLISIIFTSFINLYNFFCTSISFHFPFIYILFCSNSVHILNHAISIEISFPNHFYAIFSFLSKLFSILYCSFSNFRFKFNSIFSIFDQNYQVQTCQFLIFFNIS